MLNACQTAAEQLCLRCYPSEATLFRTSRTSSACLDTPILAKIDFSCARAVCCEMCCASDTCARLSPRASNVARLASAGVRSKSSPKTWREVDSLRSGSLIKTAADGLDWPSLHSESGTGFITRPRSDLSPGRGTRSALTTDVSPFF